MSSWYSSLGNYTFPTVFIRLTDNEINLILNRITDDHRNSKIVNKIQSVTRALPGKSFIHVDCCAPTDSESYCKKGMAISSGIFGWQVLLESDKVHNAFASGETERIALHPYRRMARMREFRIFVKNRKISGMSQLYLDHFSPKIESRKDEIWKKANDLVDDLAFFLPHKDVAIDVYLNSLNEFMIIDLNVWGPPTHPLLYRSWERDWNDEVELKTVARPVRLKGELSVSF